MLSRFAMTRLGSPRQATATYEPDEQDELIGDAMAAGGLAFVEELHYAAMDAAEAASPWDDNGDEPTEYRRVWITAARQLVADRRAQLTATPATPSPRRPGHPDPWTDADLRQPRRPAR